VHEPGRCTNRLGSCDIECTRDARARSPRRPSGPRAVVGRRPWTGVLRLLRAARVHRPDAAGASRLRGHRRSRRHAHPRCRAGDAGGAGGAAAGRRRRAGRRPRSAAAARLDGRSLEHPGWRAAGARGCGRGGPPGGDGHRRRRAVVLLDDGARGDAAGGTQRATRGARAGARGGAAPARRRCCADWRVAARERGRLLDRLALSAGRALARSAAAPGRRPLAAVCEQPRAARHPPHVLRRVPAGRRARAVGGTGLGADAAPGRRRAGVRRADRVCAGAGRATVRLDHDARRRAGGVWCRRRGNADRRLPPATAGSPTSPNGGVSGFWWWGRPSGS
jgi:hypothetical protein